MWRLCESDLEVRPGQAVKKADAAGGGYWALRIEHLALSIEHLVFSIWH